MANHGNRNVRDQQRQRVYTAENAAFPIMKVWGDTFETIHDAQAFVDKIVNSTWWKNRTDIDKVKVADGRGQKHASCSGYTYYNRSPTPNSSRTAHGIGKINLPRGARNKNIILHELAHLLSGDWDFAAHGPEFCKAYLALVKRFLGKYSYNILIYEFKRKNVTYRTGWKVQQFYKTNKEK